MATPYTEFLAQFFASRPMLPIPGRESEMAPNEAGGYGFIVDDWTRLERFLIIGSASGTYYVSAKVNTAENAAVVQRCILQDGVRVVTMAHDINMENRAPKVDQQLFVLALALKHGDADTKRAVRAAMPEVLRTGTHLLTFVTLLDALGGWNNRSKRRIVSEWFTRRNADDLAFQALKYGSRNEERDGWSLRDALRSAHPDAPTVQHKAVYDWLCRRKTDTENTPVLILVHNNMRARLAEGLPAAEVVKAAISYRLPRESLPTEALASPAVWSALLPQTPPHALLRSLAVLSANGVLNDPTNALIAASQLTTASSLRKARVHPFAILLASMAYRKGRDVRDKKTWTPVKQIMEALDDAYDQAFHYTEPTNRRMLLGIDISQSMTSFCQGSSIMAGEAAAAMAVTLARLEPYATVVQFDTDVRRIVPVTKRTGISGLERYDGGGTDISAVVRWAAGITDTDRSHHSQMRQMLMRNAGDGLPPQQQHFDAFVILTDNMTWAGNMHNAQALETYRRTVNPKAKLVCCAMAATSTEVVDPNDPLSRGCAGLDASLPNIVSHFLRSEDA